MCISDEVIDDNKPTPRTAREVRDRRQAAKPRAGRRGSHLAANGKLWFAALLVIWLGANGGLGREVGHLHECGEAAASAVAIERAGNLATTLAYHDYYDNNDHFIHDHHYDHQYLDDELNNHNDFQYDHEHHDHDNYGMTTAQTIIFMHIPRTGGTTLMQLLDALFPADVVYHLNGSIVKLQEFKALGDERKGRIRALQGHLCYGIHKWILQACAYATILREPLERTLSEYFYIRHGADDIRGESARKSSIQRAMRTAYDGTHPGVDNTQTRYASGLGDSVPAGECKRSDLERAKLNLRDNFAVVGFTEKYDDMMARLNDSFGWNLPVHPDVQHGGAPRVHVDDLPPATLEAVQDRNRLDMELYAFAREHFGYGARSQHD